MDQPESPSDSPAQPDVAAAPGSPEGPTAAGPRPAVVPPPARGLAEPARKEPTPDLAAAAGSREPPRPIEVLSRPIRASGEDWIVSEGGRASSGRGTDSRASLLLLLFSRAAGPDLPVREILSAVPSLNELADDDLIDLLARARPYRVVQQRSEVFPDTRKKGQKGY